MSRLRHQRRLGAVAVAVITGSISFSVATPTISAEGIAPLPEPRRLLDTRPGESTYDGQFAGNGTRPAGTTLQLPIAGRAGIPADATSVVLNVTVTEPQAPGFVTVHPTGTSRPTASHLNFGAGETVANLVVARLGSDDALCSFSLAAAEVIIDVSGYFTGGENVGTDCPPDPPPPPAPTPLPAPG